MNIWYVVGGEEFLVVFVFKTVSGYLLKNGFFLKIWAWRCGKVQVRLTWGNFCLKEFVPVHFPLQERWFQSMGCLPNVNSIRLLFCACGLCFLLVCFCLASLIPPLTGLCYEEDVNLYITRRFFAFGYLSFQIAWAQGTGLTGGGEGRLSYINFIHS